MLLLVVVGAAFLLLTDAFAPLQQQHLSPRQLASSPPHQRLMAGFGGGVGGGGGGASKKTKSKDSTKTKAKKLKPRQQWDRFLGEDLKDANRVRVAARKDDKWFEIGDVKSKDDAYPEAAVIRHRTLLTDHARRMFPTQILAKDQLEWGYSTSSRSSSSSSSSSSPGAAVDDGTPNTEWTIVNKVEDMPEDIDKLIGFKGLPDPTGFYAFSGTGLKSGDAHNTDQTGYLNMKSKGITGHTGHEVHD